MRDSRGIESGATGLLKIIFPNKEPSEEEFYKYCVNPALEMRQRIRDELCKLDREYLPITMKSIYPDHFQRTHQLPSFADPEKVEKFDPSKKIELDDVEFEYDEDGNIILPEEEQSSRTVDNLELRELDERIERVELDLRESVASALNNDTTQIPEHILRNINGRIQNKLRKNPALNSAYYETPEGKLEFIDLRELQDLMVTKSLWPNFEPDFISKVTLNSKFDQLAELRNCIRHSRTTDEITIMEGKAAILWFEKILNK